MLKMRQAIVIDTMYSITNYLCLVNGLLRGSVDTPMPTITLETKRWFVLNWVKRNTCTK